MKKREQTTYSGVFQNLKLTAFGIHQVLNYECTVEIYQARVNPELWRARPMFARNKHKWEAGTAEDLMALIRQDFERQLGEWRVNRYPSARADRPSLRSYTESYPRQIG